MANKNRNRNNYSTDENWEQNRRRSDDDFQNRNTYGGYGNDYSGQDRNYGNRGYGNEGNYSKMSNENYGGYSNQDQYSSDSNWNQDNDWNRGQGQWGGNYGTSGGYAGREDRNRRNVDSGNYGGRNRSQRSMYGGDTSNYGNANQGSFDRDWWDKTRDEVSSWFGDDDAERRRRSDRQHSGGGYKGKGPKDYKRSEERIKEDAYDRLSDDDMVDATNVQVQVQDNEVILSGTVNERSQKRRAEDIVESISGVANVQNNIRVSRGGDTTDATDKNKLKNW
ncbi:MAG TPA: BON domain-containing protein [Chitinophagaceae bacterium]|nr:BON domain-containing protein [Chitinophagaceae bacterium]